MTDLAYYEDIETDIPRRTRFYPVSEDEIIRFAREWNPEPYHIDPEAAKESKIGRIFAAGPHLIAICTKLTNEIRPRPVTVAGMGWDELRFRTPVFPGDQVLVEITPLSKRLSGSQPGFGIVVYGLRLLNQDDREVLTYSVTTMVQCREGSGQ
jgi:acyl dehydratase